MNRIENMRPTEYRIVRINGELTLQGLFEWISSGYGTPECGAEWRTIPTVDIPADGEAS